MCPGGPAVLDGAAEGGERVRVTNACVGRQRGPVPARERQAPQLPRPGLLGCDHLGEPFESPDRLEHLRGWVGTQSSHRGKFAQRERAGPRELVAKRPEIGGRRQYRQPRPALASRAQLVVDLGDSGPQPAGAVAGDQVDRGWRVVGWAGTEFLTRELLERVIERGVRDPLGVGSVEHDERRIEAGGEGMGAQHPRAKPVDGRDERALGRAGGVVGGRAEIQFPQPAANPVAHLGRGLLGERDREDRRDVDPVLEHRAGEPLDQHRRLAATGARVEQQIAVASLDRDQLLIGERALRHRDLKHGKSRGTDTHRASR